MSEALIIDVNKDGSVTAILGATVQIFSEGTEKENFMAAVEWGDSELYKTKGEKGDS